MTINLHNFIGCTLLTCTTLFSSYVFSEETISMDGLSIIGNKELPNVLYILPWKSPDLPDMSEPVLTELINTSLKPVDRQSILRNELYSRVLKPQ